MAHTAHSDLSLLNIKQTSILLVMPQDKNEKYEEAVQLFTTMHTHAKECDCLDLYLRLSLGLRIKDIINSISMPALKYEEKVNRLISVKYLLPEQELKQIFSFKELQGFKKSVADVCNYLTLARHSEKEVKVLTEQGEHLTGNLMQLWQLFFERIQLKQPLSALEQTGEVSSFSTEPEELLTKQLMGLKTPGSETVPKLLSDLNRNPAATINKIRKRKKTFHVIPSSQLEEEDTNVKKRCLGNLDTPLITQFAKPVEVKGCLILLNKLDSESR